MDTDTDWEDIKNKIKMQSEVLFYFICTGVLLKLSKTPELKIGGDLASTLKKDKICLLCSCSSLRIHL